MKNKYCAVVVLAMATLLFLPLAANADQVWNFFGNQAPFNDPFPPGTNPAIAVGSGAVNVTNAGGFTVTLTPYADVTNGTVGQLTGRNLGPASDEQGAGVGPGPYLEADSTTFEVNGSEAIRIDLPDFFNIPGAASIHLFFNSLTPFVSTETAQIWQDSVGAGGTLLGTIVHNPITFPAPEDFSVPATAFGHPLFVTASIGDFLLYGVSVDTVGVAGCTLTLGFWKNHPDNPTWNKLPNGTATQFFFSGQTWLQVLQTPPAGGNAYYILAHQYIAAVLNILNGASTTPTVDAALLEAQTFFNNPAHTPSTVLSSTERNHLIALADLLDQYNEGLIGPGACSEN
jgi:hypothetical protein